MSFGFFLHVFLLVFQNQKFSQEEMNKLWPKTPSKKIFAKFFKIQRILKNLRLKNFKIKKSYFLNFGILIFVKLKKVVQ